MMAGAIGLQLSSENCQRPCSMGTLVAAVVSGARSPSSPYDCVARRASALNVVPSRSLLHLSSASSSSSASGGCGLYLSLVVTKSKFFPVEHGRVKHRKRIIMVKGSNSTFELEEGRIIHEVHSEEPRVKQEEFVVRGRVGWSHDGKAKILWGTQQPQDRVAQPAEKDRSDAFVSLDRSPQLISGESEDFRARRQQRAFPSSSKVSRRGLNRHNDLFEKASKNNSIKDSRIEGTSTTSAHNGLSLFGSSAPPRGALSSGENNYQSSSPSTSRLEEILENFKISKKRESYRSQRKQSAERGDLSSEGDIAESQDIHTFAQSRIITQTSDDINVGYQTFLEHEGSSVDMFLGVEDDYHERVPNSGRKSRIGRKDKYGDIDGYNTHRNSVMPLKGEMGSSTISQVQSLGKRVEPGSFERQVTLMGRVKHNLEDDDSESDAKVQHENFRYSRPYNTASKSKTRNERRRGASLNNNSINSRSDSKAESWGRVPNHDAVNSTGVHSGSKLNKQGSGVDHFHIRQTDGVLKSGNRDTRIDSQDKSKQYTKGQYMRGPNNDYRSTVHKYSVDMEDNLEISFSSSSEDEGSHHVHVQSKRDKQQILSSSVKPKNNMLGSLVEDGKASWHNQFLPGLPFELQFSYSEAPNAPIIRYREPPYSPLGPDTLGRPWTGGRPLTKSKKNLPVFDSFKPPPKGKKGVKHVQDPGPYRDGQGPKPAKSRDEILGEPLTSKEVAELVDKCQEEKRQLNLGRDGLTHNMLDLIHNHWKRRRVVRIRCLGVPTVDMDNVCFHLEDKTGGKIIFRRGGFIYLFRGRNYNYKDRPEIPLMLWKPRTPVYPRLIERAPGGLTKEQADQLRLLGKKIEPLCTLAKNGIYLNLVNDVRAAFKLDKLVRINCRGLNPSDYKKIGAKLRDLVPCVLLSFEDEQILMWKGNDAAGSTVIHSSDGMDVAEEPGNSLPSDTRRTSLGVSDLGADDHTDDHVVDSNTHIMNEGLSSSSVMPVSSSSSHDKGENNSISRNNNSTLSYPSDNSQSHHGSEDTHDAIHAEAANIGSFMAGSEINSSLEMAQVFQNKLGPLVGAQSTSVDSVSDTLADVLSSCPKEQSEDLDQNIPDISEPKVLSISGDVWDGHVDYKEGTMALESVIEIPEALNEGRAIEHSSYVHELWNQAIESKTAIQVEDKMDDDFYFAKAGELANAVPTTEEYSRQLVHKLSLKIEKTKNSEDEMLMHYRMLQKLKLEKKLSKRRFRTRKIAPEEGPQDLPQSSGDGMPIDELVQILSIR